MKTRFTLDAKRDFDAAHHWYEQQINGLGEHFVHELDITLARITANPEAYPIIRKNIRRAVLHRFPFSLFYVLHPDEVLIIAVLHHANNIKYWQKNS